jgi:hypothetical protein
VRKDRLRPRAKPKVEISYFDPKERRREKQASRDADAEALRSGKITREELQQQNSMFAAFDLQKAKIVPRKMK